MGATGNFFAIGKQQWNAACDLGLNPAVSFVVMARGTGHDNSTTAWSMNAIEKYAGITWRRARDAVISLKQPQLVTQTSGGARPRYKLAKPESTDDLIWLPNEIVAGANVEIPPLAKIRQRGDVETLRVFVSLYSEQDLVGDGGIARDLLFQNFERTKIMDMAQYTVFGFNRPKQRNAWETGIFARYRGNKKVDIWTHLTAIEQLGLLQWVVYLAESERPYAELVHALSGDDQALRVADAAANLADELPGGFQHEADGYDYVLPVLNHLANAAVVSIARLTYRPKTSKTSSWLAKHTASCKQAAEMYESIARGEYRNAA